MSVITQASQLRDQRALLDAPPAIDLQSNMRMATDRGASLLGLAREVFNIYLGPGHLTPAEYFYYRLWEPDLSAADKRKFVGKHVQETMHRACNDFTWYAVTHDKLLLHSVLERAGLPMPAIEAVVHPSRFLAGPVNQRPGARHLADQHSLRQYLSEVSSYPAFGKPIDGMYSLGAFRASIAPMDAGERVSEVLVDDKLTDTGDLADRLLANPAGYLLQRPLIPHPEMAALTGRRLSSARLLILLTSAGPVIESAVLKIPVGANIADNYWRQGNLLGAIDRDSGRILRVVTGTGSHLRESPNHPDSGITLPGHTVPDWPAICQLALRAALLFAAIKNQSWDIAISEGGPHILEINAGGDLNLHQLAHRRGALTPSMLHHLATNGLRI